MLKHRVFIMPEKEFCINILYVIFKTATGIYYRSGILIRRNTEDGK